MGISVSAAARVLGRVRSARKAEAARKNGKLGGRPRITNAQIEKFASTVVQQWREISAPEQAIK